MQNVKEENSPFSKWRAFFWPVYRTELKILIPMLLMYFLISFNYNLLRATKDTMIVTAKASGAQAIPFLKTWAILPMAFFITLIFTRLANRFNTRQVFYIMLGSFLAFFALFGFVLYPLHEHLHPHAMADKLQANLPEGFSGFIAIFRNWTFSTFYIMSELWSTAILSVLFWGFVNEIMNSSAARRFFILINLAGNLGSILSGKLASDFAVLQLNLIPSLDRWGNNIILLTTTVLIAGGCTLFLFRWMNKHGIQKQAGAFKYKRKNGQFKMGIRKNIAYLAKSKYLISLAVIVVTYNIALNLTEVVWKDQLKLLCPDPNAYQAYMGRVIMFVGIVATGIALFSNFLFQRFSWTFNAMIPPAIILITGVGFFSFLLMRYFGISSEVALLGFSPLAIGVFFGAAQNCLSRATKYTLFDATKEIAFVPLDQESQAKGKAVIDGVGSRLGKSGGAILFQLLFMGVGTISASIPYVAVLLLGVVAAWITSVRSLGRQFSTKEKTEASPTEELQPKEA